jgi:HTH-type transcriptional regulator/antitoxin HigA
MPNTVKISGKRTNASVNPQKYGRLLSEVRPVVIKTEKENDRAITIVEDILNKGNKLSSEESALLELLGKLISDFEEAFYQPRSAAPHEIIEELMDAQGLTQKDLLGIFGSKSRTSEAVRGKRELSKNQVRALADFFNVSVELFI